MGSTKPKAMQTPFKQEQNEQQSFTNTFDRFSIADSDEAKNFLGLPLDFGGGNYAGEAYKDIPTDFNIDPGVGHRTGLAEQEVGNRYDSAFNAGVPAWIRNMNRQKEVRDVQAQGAFERQNAEYGAQQLRNNALTERARMRDAAELARANMADTAAGRRTEADLARRERLLPQILQTGGRSSGSGASSGFGTQIVQPQPGFWQRLALGAAQGAGSTLLGKIG